MFIYLYIDLYISIYIDLYIYRSIYIVECLPASLPACLNARTQLVTCEVVLTHSDKNRKHGTSKFARLLKQRETLLSHPFLRYSELFVIVVVTAYWKCKSRGCFVKVMMSV